ncbi:MAG: PilZ domain-containing protein [Acidobacteria bacterium]|nr:PilZ domain-containing protein [Acidobacteriota bacterium]
MSPGEQGLPGVDRREYFRARYFSDVEIAWGSSVLKARTNDISLGGMLVELENPLWVGAEFEARVAVGESPPVEAVCVVKQVIPGVGMGVEFTDLKPADHNRLRKLIESLPH